MQARRGQLYIALALAALSTTLRAERAGVARKKEDKSEKREGVNAVVKMHRPARPARCAAVAGLSPSLSRPDLRTSRKLSFAVTLAPAARVRAADPSRFCVR